MSADRSAFLPVSAADCAARGWDCADFVYVTGDAYVDHPSFGVAIISRVLEAEGFRVAILSQPDFRSCDDFRRFGRPRLGFLVTAGNIDSMVAHYTVAKKRRSYDYYSPGGKMGLRPDRAAIVYCNRIREAYGDVPIILGGLEASLRRFAHYDYWDDRIRRSILVDSRADLLTYGMGENILIRIAQLLDRGIPVRKIRDVRGCVWLGKRGDEVMFPVSEGAEYDVLKENPRAYAEAYAEQYRQTDAVRGHAVTEYYGERMLVQNPPMFPLERAELDRVYALPYARTYHPDYEAAGGVPAIAEVRFSITHNRGCFGACNFCALAFHQGREVRSRSVESVVEEAKKIARMPDFKGYIHDVGGPTANFRAPACARQAEHGVCAERKCLAPTPCKNLRVDHTEYAELLRQIEAVPGVKRVFIRSGIRFDYLLLDPDPSFFRQLVSHHVSGQLKVAPEHCTDHALTMMGKPRISVFEKFRDRYFSLCREVGLEQYLVPYLMSSHPGTTLRDAVDMAIWLKQWGYSPEQVQDFYPTPGTVSTVMYATGIHPLTGKEVYVCRDYHEKQLQRALLQSGKPGNAPLVREALRLAGREELIGSGPGCLVREERGTPAPSANDKNRSGASGQKRADRRKGSRFGGEDRRFSRDGAPGTSSRNTGKQFSRSVEKRFAEASNPGRRNQSGNPGGQNKFGNPGNFAGKNKSGNPGNFGGRDKSGNPGRQSRFGKPGDPRGQNKPGYAERFKEPAGKQAGGTPGKETHPSNRSSQHKNRK